MTLNRYEIGADGKPAGFKAPAVTYRFERIAAPWGWRTVFSLIAAERQKVQSLQGPEREVDSLSVVRLEDDGDGTPIRVTTRDGRRPVSRLPVSVVKDGLDKVLSLNPGLPAVFLHDEENETGAVGLGSRLGRFDGRRPWQEPCAPAALLHRYGGSTGKHQGFDRYESVQGPQRIEVLADPQSSVVVAVNTFRDGVALDRTTLIYTPAQGPSSGRGFVRNAASAPRRARSRRLSSRRSRLSSGRTGNVTRSAESALPASSWWRPLRPWHSAREACGFHPWARSNR